MHPPLKLGDRPRLLEQFAQGAPFVLGEVDTYIVLSKPKRERWPLVLGQRREEMPAVPRTLGRPSFEHGPELGQVGVSSNEIVHAARWAKVDIHAQLRATCLRKRELQVIDLERLRQDNSAAKIIFVWTRWSHGLAVMSHPIAPSGETPGGCAARGNDLVISNAFHSF